MDEKHALELILNKLNEMDKRFDTIESKLEEHDKRFDAIDEKLESIQEQTAHNAELEYHVNKTSKRVERLEIDNDVIKRAIRN